MKIPVFCKFLIYSLDPGKKIISFAYNGSKVEQFIFGVRSVEGISIDWVSRNIFWTGASKTIEVANMDTKKKKVLIKDGIVNPRGIAVHPHRG